MTSRIRNPKNIAEKLRLIRFLHKWGQADLARHLGINQSSVSRLENGLSNPHNKLRDQIETLMKEFYVGEHEIIDRVLNDVAASSEFRDFIARVIRKTHSA